MDERRPRVKALFQAAVERPEAERSAFLDDAAAGDDELRREVESLLASDAAGHRVLDRFPISDAAATVPALDSVEGQPGTHVSSSVKPGDRIGAYEVGALIGAGAMGQVYRARDTRLNRDVALKVLPETLELDADRMARFKREAQMLAALNHPNIAAIYGMNWSFQTGRSASRQETRASRTVALR